MLLKKCNITPYVLLDGGYELKKLKTVRERLRSRIGVIKYIVPLENYLALPLMMREVFTSALKHCNVPAYRCLFEADNEIAMLARKLNCPVLSYDSDFYIFDGQYIPYVTITPKVYKKTTSKNTIEVEIMQKKQKGQKKNPKRKAKKVTIELEEDQTSELEEETYNYLDCCIYTIENLTEGSLDNDMLPLFAIMLGNDFISRRWFSKFYRNVSKRKVKKKKSLSPQQKRIHTLLAWLQHETLHSAIKKILECVKQHQRQKLWYQIRTAMNGYRIEKSKSFEFFGFEDDSSEDESETILDMTLDEIMALESEASEDESEVDEEEGSENQNDEDQVSDIEETENGNGFEAKDIDDEDFLPDPQDEEEADEVAVETVQRKTFQFPEWFVSIFQTATTPRFMVDLIRSHRYINYPQVENFSGIDSNAISYQILYQLYAILISPKAPRLYYYTRIPKQVRYEVKKFESELFPQEDDFDPSKKKKNMLYIKKVFERSFSNVDEIFNLITGIPENHQLFVLAVIYWIKRSSAIDCVFLQTVILSLITLNVIDKKCDKIHRDGAIFTKKYEKHLKELKEKEVLVPAESLTPMSVKLIVKSVTKSEALLCMENFVSHFTLSPKFARKHADFRRNVVHTFSELQSVIYNLYALNSVLQFPFENIKIENYFNGLFLYNMYLNLKSRTNSLDYIRSYLLNHSTGLMMIFIKLYDLCLEALPYLRKEVSNGIVIAPKAPKKSKPKTPKKAIVPEHDCKRDSSDGEEFVDLNNKFSQLLMM